jgi:hypothetical protein
MDMDATWLGPFCWPGFGAASGLPELPAGSGVYLWTIERSDGYLIYAAGITENFRRRFEQHTEKYLAGGYTIFDIAQMQAGRRIEIWHGAEWAGWRFAERPERQIEFAEREGEISEAAKLQLDTFRVFITSIDTRRVRERIEAAIMNCLYAAPSPLCDLPDKGMRLTPRRLDEEPIAMRNVCASKLHGLPELLSI